MDTQEIEKGFSVCSDLFFFMNVGLLYHQTEKKHYLSIILYLLEPSVSKLLKDQVHGAHKGKYQAEVMHRGTFTPPPKKKHKPLDFVTCGNLV